MADYNEQPINYKPKIEYSRDYYIDGYVPYSDEPVETIPLNPDGDLFEDERKEILDKIEKIEKLLDIAPEDVRKILTPSLQYYKRDLSSDKWHVPDESEFVRNDETTSDDMPTPDDDMDDYTPNADISDDIPKLFPDDIELDKELGDVEPFVKAAIKKRLDDTKVIYQDYVDSLYRSLSRFWKDNMSVAIPAGVGSIKELQMHYILSGQSIPNTLKHVSDSITRSQIKRKQNTLFFTKIYNIDKTIAHLRQNDAAQTLRDAYYEGRDKAKSYGDSISGDDWRNSKYITANDYLDTHQNQELARARHEYDEKYFKATKNFYKYLMSSCTLTDGILRAYTNEATSKAVLMRNGIDINKHVEEEAKLKEHEAKALKKTTEARIEKSISNEAERVEKIKSAIKKSDEEVAKFFSDFADPADFTGATSSSDNSKGESNSSDNYDVSYEDGKQSKKAQKIIDFALKYYKENKSKIYYNNNSAKGRGKKRADGKLGMDCTLFTYLVMKEALGINTGEIKSVGQQLNMPGGKRIYVGGKIDKMMPGDICYQVAGKTGYQGHPASVNIDGHSMSKSWSHVYIYLGDHKCVECTKWSGAGVDGLHYQERFKDTYASTTMFVRRF